MANLLKLYKYIDGVNDTPFPNEDEQVVVSSYRYDVKRMGGAPTISCTIMHPSCLDKEWDDTVYTLFNGEKYFIKQTPSSSYDNTSVMYKHELELVSERVVLDNVYVYDVVDGDSLNDKPISNSSKFSFFGTIHEFAERLNQSLQYSKLEYRVVVDGGISSEAMMVSFQDQFFSSAIQESYNTYNVPYYFVGKHIHLGYTNNAITRTFKYGKDASLLSIQKQNANYKIVNRVTGVGSADNIPYYYPNDYESKEEVEANGGTWINPQTNLMPSIYRESLGRERFYEALNNTYKFPDSNEYYEFENPYIEGKPKEHIVDFENVKPTIKGITNAEGLRIDMFKGFAYDLNDNDETDEEGNYLHPYFFAKLRKFDGEHGFNLFDHAIDEQEMVISMTSGSCGACEFVIGVDESTQKNVVQVDGNGNLVRDDNGNVKFGTPQDKQNDTINNEVWIALRKDVDTFGVIMPNATNNYKPSVNDTFVILHIDLPKAYIIAAEDKLKAQLIEYMSLNNSEKFNFSISFSRIFFAENPDILEQLNENSRIQIEYDNTTYELYISSYSYSMSNDKPLPEIRIELSDTLTISQNALQTAINEVKSEIIGSGFGGNDILKLGLKYFLRKDTDDRSKGKIASDKAIEVGKFVAGASGAIIQVDKESGQTIAEIDKLYVRMKAYFETLEIINVNSMGGKMILSPVGSVTCLDVEETDDAYRCYFLGEQDGEIIENRFVVDDQSFSQMFNAQVGVTNNISNHYYWRLVTAVSNDVVEHNNNKCHYIDLSKTDCDVDSNVPKAGDVINHRGNRSNRDRQNFIEFSSVGTNAPYITLFQGVNSYSLEGKDYVSFGYDQSTGQAYMNVYGRMFIGNRDESSFLRYTPENGLEIKGKLSVGSTYDGKEIGELFNAQKEDLEKFNEAITKEFENIRNELDGVIDTWFGEGEPTLDNYPSVDWVTDSDKDSHLGDLYYSDAGKAYRFQYTPEKGYHWTPIEDSDVVKALEAAKKAQDTADGKRRVFLEQPFPPYDMGDLWAGGADKPLMRCINSRESGSFFETDWALADDTHAYADAINEKLGGAIRGLEYLKKALGEETTVSGGLVLTSQIRLGYTDGVGYRVMAGTNGVLDEDLDGKSIAFWAGGDMSDIENGGSASNAAKYLVRMDGSGYAAGGNLSWDKDGNISVDLNAFFAGKEDGELLVELQDNRYLRKDKDDSTPYGLTVGGKLRLNGTLGFGEKTISKFIRYADSDHEATDAGIYSSLMVDKLIEGEMELLTNKFIRKDMDDSTPYTLGVQSLLIKDKRINNMIRYYDEEKPESSDVDIYSALMIDNLIKDELKVVDDKYLKRKEEDSAEKHIEFQEGITVWQLAKMFEMEVSQLATIAEAVVNILRSSKFVDGFMGEGYQIWKSIATGDWNMTIDRLTVRKIMSIYELIIQKIRSVGGMVVVSAGNGKVKEVIQEGMEYKFTFEDVNTFVVNDLIRCQNWTGNNVKSYWVEVIRVAGDSIYTRVRDYGDAMPEAGDEVVLMGNTKNKLRQGLVLISASEDGQPRVDCYDGIKSTNLEDCLKARMGNLDGIRDSRFPSDLQPQGYGLYGNNCYLTGVFVLSNGVDVQTQFAILEGQIRANMSSVQQQINAEDNYLGNASLTNDLSKWEYSNDVKVFLTSGGLLHFNDEFYSNKVAVAGIVKNGSMNVLRIKNSYISQKNADFNMHPSFDLVEQMTTDEEDNEVGTGVMLYRPRMFYVSFKYMVTKRGTLNVHFKNEESRSDFEEYTPIRFSRVLEAGSMFQTMDDIAGKWNGTGDFYLSFDGDMYLYDLALSDNALADMEEKWDMKFELTDKKVELNFEHIKQQGEDLEAFYSEYLRTAEESLSRFTAIEQKANSDYQFLQGEINQTAENLTIAYKDYVGATKDDITEAYESAIDVSAKAITASLTARIDNTDKALDEAEARLVKDYTAKISASASELTSKYDAKITNVETGITEAYTSAISQKADEITASLTAVETDLDGRISANQTLISTQAGRIDVVMSTVASHGNTLSTHESSIKANTNAISTKVSQTDFNALSGRVSTTESSISQNAKQIDLRVKSSDYNGNTIVSYINQTSTTVTINASKINLQGKVTVSMLASDTVTKIDSKATQSDIDASIIEFENGLGNLAYKNSISATSNLITGLGSLALASVVEVANLGTTVIENGKIKTSLINATALTLSGGQITGLGALSKLDSISANSSYITGLGGLATKDSVSYSDIGLKSWVAAADIVTAMKGETNAIGGFIQTELIAADLIVVNKLKATNSTYTYSLDANGFNITSGNINLCGLYISDSFGYFRMSKNSNYFTMSADSLLYSNSKGLSSLSGNGLYLSSGAKIEGLAVTTGATTSPADYGFIVANGNVTLPSASANPGRIIFVKLIGSDRTVSSLGGSIILRNSSGAGTPKHSNLSVFYISNGTNWYEFISKD